MQHTPLIEMWVQSLLYTIAISPASRRLKASGMSD